ncbi:MAG: hypothetical protein MI824_01410 [Hyphomicrobiales bacterium]|nr:hypothetical protein [Hyphomicrobiales bacterium]
MTAAAEDFEEFPWDGFVNDYRDTIADHLRAHTDGTNVNPNTLLTTDYLNHYNEAVMLLELLPSAPAEIAADLAEWRHETYEEHFRESGFRDKALAIAGYRNAPQGVRAAFDTKIADLEQETVLLLRQAQAMVESGDVSGLTELCAGTLPELKTLIAEASAIVNGEFPVLVASDGDGSGDTADTQSRVDALFD